MSDQATVEKVENKISVEEAVRERYSRGVRKVETALCCPVDYNTKYLDVIPSEIIERDYGCGDPSRYVNINETVLDLGSGTGKICFIASQIVGATGKVIGVDMNEDMLALARQFQTEVGDKIGYHNVTFRRGKIQDLRRSSSAGHLRTRVEPADEAASGPGRHAEGSPGHGCHRHPALRLQGRNRLCQPSSGPPSVAADRGRTGC